MALFPGLPRWAGTRKVKPIRILLKQETVSGSGITWAICKSAPCSRQTTTQAPHHSVFYRPDALLATQPPASKHWRHISRWITHTHTRSTALFPGLPGWAGTRKVKPIWILVKQETVSGSGISWAICKSAPRSRPITTPAPHYSVFYRPDALPAAQPTVSKHLPTLWVRKKQDTKQLPITSWNVHRFSNFFSLSDIAVNFQQTYSTKYCTTPWSYLVKYECQKTSDNLKNVLWLMINHIYGVMCCFIKNLLLSLPFFLNDVELVT